MHGSGYSVPVAYNLAKKERQVNKNFSNISNNAFRNTLPGYDKPETVKVSLRVFPECQDTLLKL